MLFEIIMSTAVICLILAAVLRYAAVSGAGWKNPVLKYFSVQNEEVAGFKVSGRMLVRVFLYALLFRAVIFVFGAVILYMLCGGQEFSWQSVISSYHRWDADHYVNIAQNGYASKIEDGRYVLLVFYPLYPLLMRIAAAFVRSYDVAGLAVSWICYAGACTALTALLAIDYDEETTFGSILYLSVFPFAFFFGACMTESTFLLLTVLTLYFIRKHNFVTAAVFGLLASLTRVTGVMLVFAYFAEWLQSGMVIDALRRKEFARVLKHILRNGLPVLIIPLGTAIYMLINYLVAGDAFAFLEYEKVVWHQQMQFFGKTFALMRRYAFMTERLPEMFALWLPQIAATILCLAFSIYGIRRHRIMYYGFLVPYLLTNISASWPISGVRYISCAFPMFVFMAEFSGRHKRAKPWIIVCFSMLLGVYFAAYFMNMEY